MNRMERNGVLRNSKLLSGAFPCGGLLSCHALFAFLSTRDAPFELCRRLSAWHDSYVPGGAPCADVTCDECERVQWVFVYAQLGNACAPARLQNFADARLGAYGVEEIKMGGGQRQRMVTFDFGRQKFKTSESGSRQLLPSYTLLPIEAELLLTASLAARECILLMTGVSTNAMFVTKAGASGEQFKGRFDSWLRAAGEHLFGKRVSHMSAHRHRDMFITHCMYLLQLPNASTPLTRCSPLV